MLYLKWGLNSNPLQLISQVTEPLMDKQQVMFLTSWSVPSIQYCNLQVRHNLTLSILDINRKYFRPGFCWMYKGLLFHTQAVQSQVQNRVHSVSATWCSIKSSLNFTDTSYHPSKWFSPWLYPQVAPTI